MKYISLITLMALTINAHGFKCPDANEIRHRDIAFFKASPAFDFGWNVFSKPFVDANNITWNAKFLVNPKVQSQEGAILEARRSLKILVRGNKVSFPTFPNGNNAQFCYYTDGKPLQHYLEIYSPPQYE